KMLGRQALRSFLRSGGASATRTAGGRIWRRSFADAPATSAPSAHEEFLAAWKKVAPTIEPPKTPLAFMAARPEVPGTIPTKLTVNFVLPYQSELTAKEV
ncbi:hypothetical protein KI387_026338, partial [Taxus chinensis]